MWEELDDKEVRGGSVGRLLYRRKRLRQLVAKHKIDVCISHMEGPNILNAISRLGNCKKSFAFTDLLRAIPQNLL